MAKQSLIKSILLVDDSQDSIDLYSSLLAKKSRAKIITSRHPGASISLANKQFFDIILIDVTMNYNGTQYGGLEVYKSLKDRYGKASLIVYSQFITDDLLKQYDYDFNFIEKRDNPRTFIDECFSLMTQLRKKQTCFIAMPFGNKYTEIYSIINKSLIISNYQCVRIDKRQFTKSIVEKIFTEIKDSKLIIFLSSDQNPNAFYECGFAVALNKEIITITDSFENLPFDIRDRNALSYEKKAKSLGGNLVKKLKQLTNISRQ